MAAVLFRSLASGEIGNGAVVDLAVFAEALAQEDSGRGVAVGHDGDVHVDIVWQ